jgi:polyhydroxyalkanoate synthesis regulator phasin
MEESLKKLVYAGVGLAAQATEKFEKSVNELVKKGKLSDKEGKKIVDEFFSKTEKKKDTFESKFKKTAEEVIARFKFASQDEIKSLNKRIEVLEKELKKTAPVAKKATPAVKKPVAKKPVAKKVASPANNGAVVTA